MNFLLNYFFNYKRKKNKQEKKLSLIKKKTPHQIRKSGQPRLP
jgi:hypothetical protein